MDVPPGSSLESFAAILTSGSETTGRTPRSPTTTEAVFATFDGRPGVEATVLTPAELWRLPAPRVTMCSGATRPAEIHPGRRRSRAGGSAIQAGFRNCCSSPLAAFLDARRAPRRAAGDARLGAHRQSTGTAVGSGLADPLTVARLQGDTRDDAPPVTGGASICAVVPVPTIRYVSTTVARPANDPAAAIRQRPYPAEPSSIQVRYVSTPVCRSAKQFGPVFHPVEPVSTESLGICWTSHVATCPAPVDHPTPGGRAFAGVPTGVDTGLPPGRPLRARSLECPQA